MKRKLNESQKREEILNLAKEYTKQDLNYMHKNSDISPEKAIMYVENHHISNNTLQRLFKEKATKILQS
jgi:hypothetical protein